MKTDLELKSTLLTTDGKGYEAKLAALNALELRAIKHGMTLAANENERIPKGQSQEICKLILLAANNAILITRDNLTEIPE